MSQYTVSNLQRRAHQSVGTRAAELGVGSRGHASLTPFHILQDPLHFIHSVH